MMDDVALGDFSLAIAGGEGDAAVADLSARTTIFRIEIDAGHILSAERKYQVTKPVPHPSRLWRR
jgi:hypothetical protein